MVIGVRFLRPIQHLGSNDLHVTDACQVVDEEERRVPTEEAHNGPLRASEVVRLSI